LNDAILERVADFDVLVERRSEPAVHVADQPDSGLVHQVDHFPVVGRGSELSAVQVEIDRRKLRPGDVGRGKFIRALGMAGTSGAGLNSGRVCARKIAEPAARAPRRPVGVVA